MCGSGDDQSGDLFVQDQNGGHRGDHWNHINVNTCLHDTRIDWVFKSYQISIHIVILPFQNETQLSHF